MTTPASLCPRRDHARQAVHRRPRGQVGTGMGRAGHLPLRPLPQPRGDLLDRHPAPDGERLAAHRPRVLLHPDRLPGPLQADGRLRGLLPDGLGRQRPADRAPRPELLRRARRRLAAARRGLPAAAAGRRGQERQGGRPAADQPGELHRAVRHPHRRGREGLRGGLPDRRALGRLGHQLPHHRRPLAGDRAGGVPEQPAPRRGLPGGGAGPVGRHVPDRGGPGRARGARLPRPLPPGGLPRPGRQRRGGAHRDHPPRAAARRGGPHRPPRRRAVRRAVRDHGHLTAVRGRGARPAPLPGRARQGRRHRDVLHLR